MAESFGGAIRVDNIDYDGEDKREDYQEGDVERYWGVRSGGSVSRSGDDNARNDGDDEICPKPAFHADNLKHNIDVVKRDKGFPARFTSFLEDAPVGDNHKHEEYDA